MRIRNLFTRPVLLGGTAMMAAPAVAQSIPGSPGTITTDGASRAAPLAISGIKPMPTPQVETNSISRGPFGQDPADALAGLGTTTWHPDGSVTQSPPSDKTRDIFTEEVKGATASEFATQRVLQPGSDPHAGHARRRRARARLPVLCRWLADHEGSGCSTTAPARRH